jgi:ubiquinone/menaquinone biosynthesis C-methylase UbiE
MKQFATMYDLNESTRIIDVGGYEFNWTLIDAKPLVLFVNVENEEWTKGRFKKVQGDGRCLSFADNSFDIAYSNSVVEHVGNWNDQIAFANEIRRVARQYYVQTPNKWFFVEPHLITIFIHFLPFSITRKLVRWLSLWGWIVKPGQADIDQFLKSIRLLSKKDMRMLFPDANFIEERFLGLTKSIIACRCNR